jgi:hypothetical protein
VFETSGWSRSSAEADNGPSLYNERSLLRGASFQLVNPPKAENCTRGSWRQIYSGTTSVCVNRFSRS